MRTASKEVSGDSLKKIGKIRSSYYLLEESFELFRKEPHTLMLALLSGMLSFIFVAGAFLLYVWINLQGGNLNAFIDRLADPRYSPPYSLLLICGFLLVLISTFFQSAIMQVVSGRIDGKEIGMNEAVSLTEERGEHILEWAILSSLVATMFSLLTGLSGSGVSFFLGVLSVIWTIAIFYIVPPIALEEGTLTESLMKSVYAIKTVWIETLLVGFMFGVFVIAFSAASLILAAVIVFSLFVIFGYSSVWPLLTPSLILFGILALVFAVSLIGALRAIVRVVLYRYSMYGHEINVPPRRSDFVLSALRPKK